jgi:hypothetical protein
MPVKILSIASLAAVVGFTGYMPPAQAINFGDMMNPSRWMGGGKNRDRYDDYYDDYGPYGGPWGGGPWGGGPYGGPYGAPYGGYGAPGYGYGAPGYGYGAPGYVGAPAAAAAPAAPAAPSQSGSTSKSEIDALKRRIEELEATQKTPPAPTSDWPSAPAFRPMNQY